MSEERDALRRRLQAIERIECPACREMARRKLKEGGDPPPTPAKRKAS